MESPENALRIHRWIPLQICVNPGGSGRPALIPVVHIRADVATSLGAIVSPSSCPKYAERKHSPAGGKVE